MKLTRRQLLKATFGAAHLALIERLGVPLVGGGRARASLPEGVPTRLLTIHVPGGWVPWYLWVPFTGPEITSHLPPVEYYLNKEPVFYGPDDITNLDGTGDAMNGSYLPLRGPEHWNIEGASANGRSWKDNALWENVSVVHGLDVQTADHSSARISMMSGKASATYQTPAVHAWIAWATSEIYGDDRPLGSVAVGNGPVPSPASLGAAGAPILMPSLGALDYSLGEKVDSAWSGLRNRGTIDDVDFQGAALGQELGANDMERVVLSRARALHDTTNSATDALYERIYDTYRGVSRLLAQDLIATIDATPSLVDESVLPKPDYVPSNWSFFGSSTVSSADSQAGAPDIELALKLLRSGLTSAISLELRGIQGFEFDTHGSGHPRHFAHLRAVYDVIGRIIAQLKNIPIGGGRVLLDDTLVVIQSEFSRTWPHSLQCDHWPATSVAFAGGNVIPNRQIGRYAIPEGASPSGLGYLGDPVSMIDEGGDLISRSPTSGDVVWTILQQMGITNELKQGVFLGGGPGRFLGLEEA